MILPRKDKFHNPLVEALDEPCFVFSELGEFLFHNEAARRVLEVLGYAADRKPESHETFLQILRFSGQADDLQKLFLGDAAYQLHSSRFEDGMLLRLLPQRDSGHMLRLSQSLNALPWGLLTVKTGENPRIVFCNEKAGQFLGLAPQNVIGQSYDLIPKQLGFTDEMSSWLGDSGIRHYDLEGQIGGRVVWYSFDLIPYAGEQPYCLIVLEDVTEEKIMEGQYFQAQRLESLGQLAGGVAHDFNNILSIIDGYARIAKKKVTDNPEAFGYMEHIGKAVQRGSALTTQLLTFGRHKVMRDKVFDLGALIKDQEPLLRPLMDASIALTINTEEDVLVEVAPDNICQILLNLCINARDAMPDGGNLTIDCGSTKDGHAFLAITDTGCGMTPEVKAKMFDPFYTTKDKGKGTGLGLSMVYGLIQTMKGDIDVSSVPQKGTVMKILLPLSAKNPDVQEITEDESGKIHLTGFTALVAEDEPDLLDLISGMMEEMGAKVLRASNGNEALMIQEVYDGDIDFLLTDVVMPEVNGVRLAEAFGDRRPRSKILFMSGYPANGQLSRVEVPADAYLMPKPVDFNKLSAVVKDMVKGPQEHFRHRWKTLGAE